VQASRSAASEAQALAQEAAQLKAQAQNFQVSLHRAWARMRLTKDCVVWWIQTALPISRLVL